MPDSAEPKSYRKVLQAIFGKQVVTLFPRLAHRFGGATVGLFLSQLFFYDELKGLEFPLKVDKCYEQTGLTEYEQATAREILITYKAIHAVRKGFPNTWHYTVDLDRIEYLLANPQIQVFPESDKTSKRKRQYLLTTVYGEAKNCNGQNLAKPAQSSGKNPNLNEGAINDLKPQINTDKDQEEEAPVLENFSCLDADLLQDLRAFQVFESMLPVVDQAMQRDGWTPAQVRELMVKCRQQDRNGTPAALFLTRIQELKPPTAGYDYSQYNPQPETGPTYQDVFTEAARKAYVGRPDDYQIIYSGVSVVAVENEETESARLLLRCNVRIWEYLIKPKMSEILGSLQEWGIHDLGLAN